MNLIKYCISIKLVIISTLKISNIMRLQVPLKSIKISPSCHIQLNRHAQQFKSRYTIGQLYGALYDDEAHITNILPYPDADNMPIPSELQAMQTRHKQMLNKFNLDNVNIGWYFISYRESLWEQLEIVKYYQKYINTSFVLVYQYQARQAGRNPYTGYRLADWFATQEQFSSKDMKGQPENPLVQIPAYVQKDEIFQSFFLLNKASILKDLSIVRAKSIKEVSSTSSSQKLGTKVESYITTLEQQSEQNRKQQQKSIHQSSDKGISFSEYCEYLGLILKGQAQEKKLREYQTNIKDTKVVLKQLTQ